MHFFLLAWEFLEYLLIQQYINTERTLFILLTCYWHMQHNTVALTCLLWRCFSTGICVSSSSYKARVHNIDHSFIGQHKPQSIIPKDIQTYSNTCTVYRETFNPVLFLALLPSLSEGEFKTFLITNISV